MWAIKTPHGFILDEISYERTNTIKKFMQEIDPIYSWRALKRKGYKCIRIKITEVD